MWLGQAITGGCATPRPVIEFFLIACTCHPMPCHPWRGWQRLLEDDYVLISRVPHELTCGLIRIQPAGILFSKSPIRIHMDKFPWVTCRTRSGTCISQVTRSVWVPASICGYLCKYLQVSAVTCRYNLWYRWLAAIYFRYLIQVIYHHWYPLHLSLLL